MTWIRTIARVAAAAAFLGGPSRPATASVVTCVGTVKSTADEIREGLMRLEVETRIGRRQLLLGISRSEKGDGYLTNDLRPGQFVEVRYETSGMRMLAIEKMEGVTLIDQEEEPSSESHTPASTGRTWAMFIGARDYTKAPRLKYTATDAEELAALFREVGQLEPENVVTITDDLAKKPTAASIRHELAAFTSSPRIGKDDTVVIFFSGHGQRDPKTGQGYLLPVDADPRQPARSGIKIEEVIGWISKTPAKHRVLLLDACHSGAFGGAAVESVLNQAANVVTLTSCQSNQRSFEDDVLGHGVFTSLMLDGLNGPADRDNDGVVQFDELYAYLTAEMIGGVQAPAQYFPNTVEGRPAVLPLAGTARDLALARGKTVDGEFDKAMDLLTRVGPIENIRLATQRTELFTSLAGLATNFYLRKCEQEVKACREAIAEGAGTPAARVALVESLLCLGQTYLGIQDGEVGFDRAASYLETVEEAREIAGELEALDAREAAECWGGIARDVSQARTWDLFSASQRNELKKMAEESLRSALAASKKMGGGLSEELMRAKVAGWAWQTANQKLWIELIPRDVNQPNDNVPKQYPNTELYVCRSFSEAGDSIGAKQSLLALDKTLPGSYCHMNTSPGLIAAAHAMVALAEAREGDEAAESFQSSIAAARSWLALDSEAHGAGWTAFTRVFLARAMVEAGMLHEAEQQLDSIQDGSVKAEILSGIARSLAFEGKLDEARRRIAEIPADHAQETLSACRQIAQCEIRGRNGQLGPVLDWIASLENPAQRAHAYGGLALELTNSTRLLADLTRPEGIMLTRRESRQAGDMFGNDARPSSYAPPQSLIQDVYRNYDSKGAQYSRPYVTGIGGAADLVGRGIAISNAIQSGSPDAIIGTFAPGVTEPYNQVMSIVNMFR